MFRQLLCLLFVGISASVSGQTPLQTDTVPQSEQLHQQSSIQVLELKMQQLELNRQIELLQRDTVDLNKEIQSLQTENMELDNELKKYKNGVFFGIGFGFNYFTRFHS